MEKLNIVKNILLFLQTYVSTRFGAGVVGFLLSCTIIYYGIVKNQFDTIESYKSENEDLKKALNEVNEKIVIIREEARKEAQKEAREYIDYTYSLIRNMRLEVSGKRLKTEQEIIQLEREIERRKEAF